DGHSVSDQQAACYTGFSGAAINLEKLVSVDGGTTFADADAPPGPTLIFPATPLFRYRVTNTGTVTLNNIALADTDLGSITIPTTTLAPGASFQVTVPGAFAPGQQTNTATVTGQANGETVTNSDAANYFGVAEASILVQKRVSVNNGATFVNADTPPGPALFAPTNPQFRFIVTNNGSFTLNNVALSDTTFGPIALPTSTLTAGQSVVVTLPGTFVAGQHCNLATATGEADGLTVTDTDQACFRGVTGPLPEFPDISDPAPQDQIIDRLLETIALEELALAALINAEAEKVQAVAAAGILGPVDAEQLTAVNLAVADVIRLAGVKEEHLRRKLLRLLAHKERGTGSPAP
ncbi:MAG TPA: hypothetical protein VNT01_10240, partial [Symbiobacteriaceae bacterium]|nr:hypothetical protein [Symbiobacteriaceae bacterium]